MLKRLERRPLSGAGNFRSGSTPYDNLTIAVKFADGIATAEDIRVEGPAARLTLTGTASVPAREYDMKGVASLIARHWRARLRPAVRGAGPVGRSPDLSRSRKPDPPLARRGPLLDAVKDRKTRDPVRSVLERLTGGGMKPAAAGCGRRGARERADGWGREGELRGLARQFAGRVGGKRNSPTARQR